MKTAEARTVLAEVKTAIGRTYKSAIREAWMTGNYRRVGLQKWSSPLQNIRNQFGPSWLVNARV